MNSSSATTRTPSESKVIIMALLLIIAIPVGIICGIVLIYWVVGILFWLAMAAFLSVLTVFGYTYDKINKKVIERE